MDERERLLLEVNLNKLFEYNKETGAVVRKTNTGKMRNAGRHAGYLTKMGYFRVSIDNQCFMLHRVIWVMVTGELPNGQIDHINGCRSDNRWNNLRIVNNRENAINKAQHRKGKLPWAYREGRKWKSEVRINGLSTYLGLFRTQVEAHNQAKRFLEEI